MARTYLAAALAAIVVSKIRLGIDTGGVYPHSLQIAIALFEGGLCVGLLTSSGRAVPLVALCLALGLLVRAYAPPSRWHEMAPRCGCFGGSRQVTHGVHIAVAGTLVALSAASVLAASGARNHERASRDMCLSCVIGIGGGIVVSFLLEYLLR